MTSFIWFTFQNHRYWKPSLKSGEAMTASVTASVRERVQRISMPAIPAALLR